MYKKMQSEAREQWLVVDEDLLYFIHQADALRSKALQSAT
jgi:hypothetical protein